MTTVRDLLPGDLVTSATKRVFISSCPHPVWHHLLLVVWRREDGTIRLDALGPDEEVGDVQPIEPAARAARLTEALAGRPPITAIPVEPKTITRRRKAQR